MKLNRHAQDIVNQAVHDCIDSGKIDAKKIESYTKLFGDLPTSQAIEYLQAFLKGIRREMRKYTLTIQSAVDLSTKDIDAIKRNLSSEYLITDTVVENDSSLLGGIRVKIGDILIDDSVKSKIEQVREGIKSSV
jgi:F0F1-type ATP synthase delta subunit